MTALALLAALAIRVDPGQPALAPAARAALDEVLRDAGLSSVRVTSTERSVRRQVQLMLPQFRAAAAGRRQLVYGAIGTRLYRRYLELQARRPRPKGGALRTALEEELSRLLAEAGQRTELSHVAGGANYAFDVSPRSVRDPAAFEAALRRSRRVVRCILPGQASEESFHLEVARDGSLLPPGADCNAAFAPR